MHGQLRGGKKRKKAVMNLLRTSHSFEGPLLLQLAGFLFFVSAVGAQEPAPGEPTNAPPLTFEQAQARLAEADAATGLEDTAKADLVKRWQGVVEAIRTGEANAARSSRFQQQIQEIPKRLEELEAAAEASATPEAAEVEVQNVPLTELEQQLATATLRLDEARKKLAELEAEPARRAARRTSIPEAMAQVREQLEELEARVAAVGPEAEVTDPSAVLPVARQWALTQAIAAYENEIRYYDIAGQLLTLTIDRAVSGVSAAERDVKRLQDMVLRKRQMEARDAAAEARLAKERTSELPYLRGTAESLRESNESMARARTGPDGLIARTEETQERVREMEGMVDSVITDFTSVSKRIEAAGLNNAVGMLLRNYRTDLPSLSVHSGNIQEREGTLADLQLDLIQLREERVDVADIELTLSDLLESLPPGVSEEDRATVENVFRELLNNRRDILDALIADTETYFTALQNLDSAERELYRETSEFYAYIDERVLWIASSAPIGLQDLANARDSVVWFLDREQWQSLSMVGVRSLRQHGVQYLLLFLVTLLLVLFHRRMRIGLSELGDMASKRSTVDIGPSLHATVLTLFLAVPVPLLVWSVGGLVATTSSDSEFTVSFGAALRRVGVALLLLEFVRHLLRPGGVAEEHFAWPENAVASLRRHLLWMLTVSLPLIFAVELFGFDNVHDSLSRVAFFALMFVSMAFLWVILQPSTGAIQSVLETRRGKDYGHRMRAWWRVVAAGVPLLLAIVAGAGYYYTARRLVALIFLTVALIVALLFMYGLILRWLVLTRRALAMEQARKRLAALKARATEGEQPEVPQEEVEVDLAKVDVQTQRLVRSLLVLTFLVGLWWIWAETLPALKILDRVELPWQTTRTVVNTVMVEGEAVEQHEEVEVPVTGVHVLAATLIAIMTLAATRNIPGLLEIAVLRRLDMAAGERYAVTTVIRYALAAVGGLLAFQAIGLGWGKVQWLVAAIGLGLGFGLQEIFANFVSGLIILFERPIRVGDTVTVGGISGTVTRIRIRATTILDFDRKELVVPNKDFVTSQLVNWTLSSTTLRIVIPVGIAYGSDTRRAEAVLFEIAHAHADVMREPAPEVWFLGFGDSTLNFELRVYCATLDYLLRIKHDLHMRIHERFKEEGIEIAFPQRDIHVRSVDAALAIKSEPDAVDAPEV